MGCTFSQPGSSDPNIRIFKVFNVDDLGQERNPGKIEITETDLILYQKGKDAIRWPLRSLRRYGFDAELFSFESGRRCPTGPGIYAFKCRRAEALFNLLQECIQRAGQEEHRGGGSTADSSSRPNSLVEIQHTVEPRPVDNPEYINGEIRVHEYVNTDISGSNGHVRQSHLAKRSRIDPSMVMVDVPGSLRGSTERVIQYAELDLPGGGEDGRTDEEGSSPHTPPQTAPRPDMAPPKISTHHLNNGKPNGLKPLAVKTRGHINGHCLQEEPDSSQFNSMYINVSAKEGPGGRTTVLTLPSGEDPHNYANLGLMGGGAKGKTVGAVAGVNYAQLDLDGGGAVGGQNVSLTPDSPSKRTESYAMIDFNRTQALNMNTLREDEGFRKTRHNSNIDELGFTVDK